MIAIFDTFDPTIDVDEGDLEDLEGLHQILLKIIFKTTFLGFFSKSKNKIWLTGN